MSCSGNRNIQNYTHTHNIYYIYVHLRPVIMNPRVSARRAGGVSSNTRTHGLLYSCGATTVPHYSAKYYKAFRSYARLFVIVIVGDFETWIIIYTRGARRTRSDCGTRAQLSPGLIKTSISLASTNVTFRAARKPAAAQRLESLPREK